MNIIIGPVLARDGGYAFDYWIAKDGFVCGCVYRRIEDAYYARRALAAAEHADAVCETLSEFVRGIHGGSVGGGGGGVGRSLGAAA
ncbi:hypothetical protein GCM10011611_20610 [Aliidongia dinghuensis]|uniref:Uncharacterized protein n=1 Tax=Aliidongia dinghuensis TaxID=1867774 RepID=A0A8J2YTM4_9PROT|nr:hypothetical protein [Aliidongia dinghuensis]GGF14695.1 hypothetical protein GCM10011611_20610 [Aliidongia dinghuensis]